MSEFILFHLFMNFFLYFISIIHSHYLISEIVLLNVYKLCSLSQLSKTQLMFHFYFLQPCLRHPWSSDHTARTRHRRHSSVCRQGFEIWIHPDTYGRMVSVAWYFLLPHPISNCDTFFCIELDMEKLWTKLSNLLAAAFSFVWWVLFSHC